jgi:ABC-2 type transport system permease protein
VRRAVLDARTRVGVFAYVFAIYSWLQAAGYHSAYPTLADRIAFARAFAGNDAIRLFYGYPYDVLTVGGYSAWRVGGTLVIVAAAFGVLGAVRGLRGEEEAGRSDTLLAGAVGRRATFWAAVAATGVGMAFLWFAEFAGFVIGGLSTAGSAYSALATVSVVPVFAGMGAVASQLGASRRVALGLGFSAVAVLWIVRVFADTVSGAGWLRWATPLGWAEELRPYAGARPLVLLLAAGAAIPLLLAAARIWVGRDVGTGLFAPADVAAPNTQFLSSATAQALRLQRGVLAIWTVGVGGFGVILGMISTSISSAGISKNLQKDLAKLGTGSITTPTGYLSFVFVVFVLAVCLFVCSQISAAREEEANQYLETLLAATVSRSRWLVGRLVLAAVTAAVLSALAGLLTWAGATSQGISISLLKMLEAGANCVPASLLFLGLGTLAYALLPRAGSAVSYALVGAAFLWYLVGALLGIPRWLVDITPFQHIGLVPAQGFRVEAALVMVAIGVLAAGAGLAVFRRRDVLGQ